MSRFVSCVNEDGVNINENWFNMDGVEGEATFIVADDTVHYRYMGDDALMTKIRDDGCIPSIEAEEDPLLNHLLIAMLCVGVVILLLIIVLLFVLFKKKPKRVTILQVNFSVCSRNIL